MTASEAINRIREHARIHLKKEPQAIHITQALQLACIALEKETPKFVECPKGFQGVRNTRFYCPNCSSLTRHREERCHKCGQAVKYPREVYVKAEKRIDLDWSDTE